MNNKKIIIREVKKSDFNLLANYLSQSVVPKYSQDEYLRRFNFWWIVNPAFKINDKYGWIIIDNSKKNYIKGFLGSIPAEYKINNSTLKTVSASTWIVSPKYRKYSIQLYFSFLKQKKDIFLNSTPADITSEIFIKTNFIDIAKNQNNYLILNSFKPILYLIKKYIKHHYASALIAKLILFIYNILFNIKLDEKYLKNRYELITSQSKIEKLLEKTTVKLMNLSWVLNADKNKFFLEILNKDGLYNYIYLQYVNNPVNKLNYIQVLETDIFSGELLKNVVIEIAEKYNYNLDYIILYNLNRKFIFYGSFIRFNFLSRSKCLIKSDKMNVNKIIPNGALGEKGFIIWN